MMVLGNQLQSQQAADPSQAFEINFTAPETVGRFMLDEQRVRMMRGPVGSGKSTGMAMELFRRSTMQAPGPDGIRRTQNAVVRNTGNQLRTTCLVTILQLFGPLARWKPSEQTVIFDFDDVYSEWLLLPLDTPDNIRRLLSLELTMAWISEFREIDPQIVRDVFSRCGRFPSMMYGGPSFYGLMGETNAFDEDSPWYDQLEENLPKNWSYFVQPPGATELDDGELIATGENAKNLVPTYYQDQADSNGGPHSNWSRQYIFNEIGPSVSGEAVFRENFEFDFHVSREPLEVIPQIPLCVGLDTDRNPAAVVTQLDPTGQMKCVGEEYASNMGMELFVSTKLTPLLAQHKFMGCPVYLVIDPSAVRKGSVGEESVLMALRRLGFVAVLAQTNAIEPRLQVVDRWLQKSVRGNPGFVVDYKACPTLTLAMQSRYRFKKKKTTGEFDGKPDKNHPFSDLADGLQYALLGGSEAVRAAAIQLLSRPTHSEYHEPSPLGWT